jgi:serine/threonine protein kinase
MPEAAPKKKPPSKIDGGKYELEKKLGAGCFGEVYRGLNTKTKEQVAVKTEDIQTSAPQLEQEADLLNMLRQPVQQQGFVECFYFGKEGAFNCMVMELLGKSVEDMVQKCGGKFTAKTAVLTAEQVLHRIEYLHSKGIIHRDIKPENFMFGVKGKVHHVYLIDFGLSKRYWDKRHSPMRQNLSLTGTARYASINAHKGLEQSRRDDLEALGHMFMYFLRGSVPWSGLDAKTKQEKYKKIMEKKESVPLNDLCEGFPEAFEKYLRYCRLLQFTERPDYDMINNLWKEVRTKENIVEDHAFEWFDGKPPPDPLVAVMPRQKIMQPDSPEEKKGGGGAKKWSFCLCGGNSAAVTQE